MPFRLRRLFATRTLLATLGVSVAILVLAETWSPGRIRDYTIDQALMGDFPNIQYALELYRKEHGTYPDRLEQLGFERLPEDPWGHPYVYERSAPGRYALRSMGVNGIDEHGAGDDVVPEPKHYDCKTYGVSCPPDPIDVLKIAVQLTALASAVILVLVGPLRFARWLAPRLKRPT